MTERISRRRVHENLTQRWVNIEEGQKGRIAFRLVSKFGLHFIEMIKEIVTTDREMSYFFNSNMSFFAF